MIKDERILVRVSAEEKEEWTRAARERGHDGLSQWIRWLLRREVGTLVRPPDATSDDQSRM